MRRSFEFSGWLSTKILWNSVSEELTSTSLIFGIVKNRSSAASRSSWLLTSLKILKRYSSFSSRSFWRKCLAEEREMLSCWLKVKRVRKGPRGSFVKRLLSTVSSFLWDVWGREQFLVWHRFSMIFLSDLNPNFLSIYRKLLTSWIPCGSSFKQISSSFFWRFFFD